MNLVKQTWIVGWAVSLVGSMAPEAATIVSWDDATQRGGDLVGAGAGNLEYGSLAATLNGRGHTLLPGVAALDAGALAGVDVFFWGVSSRVLTAAEGSALADFVSNGGLMVLETNSLQSEADAANLAYAALGLGSRVGSLFSGGDNGTFENVVSRTTLGGYGDLRGLDFDGSPARDLDDTGHTLVAVSDGGARTWVEYQVGAGAVLGVGDPYGFNLFNGNPNNIGAYVNFIEGAAAPQVPDGGSPALLLLLGAGVFAFARTRCLQG